MPKVSIIIPTYERIDYLKRLLDSIIKQTFSDYEIIIVDDCSANFEEYKQVIQTYQDKVKSLIYIRNEKNYRSPVHGRNIGMQLAQGEYIAFCDDDDEWYPEKLQLQVNKFEKSKIKYGLVYTWADTVDEKTNQVVFRYRGETEGNCLGALLKKDFIPTSSVMVRKSELMEVNGMDEQMQYCCEDWDTWVRMLKNGTVCGVVKEVLLKYYRHPGKCISEMSEVNRGYIQFYRKHVLLALKVSPIAFILFIKHILSIMLKRRRLILHQIFIK